MSFAKISNFTLATFSQHVLKQHRDKPDFFSNKKLCSIWTCKKPLIFLQLNNFMFFCHIHQWIWEDTYYRRWSWGNWTTYVRMFQLQVPWRFPWDFLWEWVSFLLPNKKICTHFVAWAKLMKTYYHFFNTMIFHHFFILIIYYHKNISRSLIKTSSIVHLKTIQKKPIKMHSCKIQPKQTPKTKCKWNNTRSLKPVSSLLLKGL